MRGKKSIFILLVILGITFVVTGIIRDDLRFAAKTATYGNFDVPGTESWVNKLDPGIADGASGIIYGKVHYKPLILIGILFAVMLLVPLIQKRKDLVLRIMSQWGFFAGARLGVFRVSGLCPINRTEFGIFPFLNCMACEMATGACPIGMIQWGLIRGDFPYFAFGIILLSGVLLGRAVCGWLCPFGFVLDVLHRLSLQKFKLWAKLSYLKYILLLFIIGAPLASAAVFCIYLCQSGTILGLLPYYLTTGLHGFKEAIQTTAWWKSMLGFHLLTGIILIIGIVLVSGRWFCRFLCPLGAFYGFFNKISLVTVRHNEKLCFDCGICNKNCPMDIDLRKAASHDCWTNCIRCGRCTKLCDARTLEFNSYWKKEGVNNESNVAEKAGGIIN